MASPGRACRPTSITGPVYYQKPWHMVRQDARPVRAPGRSSPGSPQRKVERRRVAPGEMERDCLIAYGASMLLNRAAHDLRRCFNVEVCGKCGLLAYTGWCHSCQTSMEFLQSRIPYACKLLFQELQSMNIVPRQVRKNTARNTWHHLETRGHLNNLATFLHGNRLLSGSKCCWLWVG